MNTQNFLSGTQWENPSRERNRTPVIIRPRIRCSDGFEMSVQASHSHYCTPRMDNAEAYSTVEVGYPSVKEELIAEYADIWEETPKEDDYTHCIYNFVPIEVVDQVLEKHGGIERFIGGLQS